MPLIVSFRQGDVFPIPCMYGILTYTYQKNQPDVREIRHTWMVCLLFWTSFPGDSAAMTQLDSLFGGHVYNQLKGHLYIYITTPKKVTLSQNLSGWWSLITWSQLIIDPRLWIGMLCHTRQLTTDLVSRFFCTKKITHQKSPRTEPRTLLVAKNASCWRIFRTTSKSRPWSMAISVDGIWRFSVLRMSRRLWNPKPVS